MHAYSWFRYGELDSVIRTSKGARQGCVFGSIVFNSGYATGLQLLYYELDKLGIVLRLPAAQGAFWEATRENHNDREYVNVLDAVFVDDECLVHRLWIIV